jgi:hypothetical protein
VPKKAGDGLIWLRYYKTGKLVAVDQKGAVRRMIDAKDGFAFFALSPAADKLWFAGRDGKLPDQSPAAAGDFRDRLTLHVRGIDDRAEGTDLGAAVTPFSVVSPDGETVAVVEIKQNGTVDQPFEFANRLVDVATKKETRLDLPGNYQLFGIAPDGKWVLSLENVFPVEKGKPAYRLHQVSLPGGKPRLLSGTISGPYGCRISPDGGRVLVFGEDYAALKDGKPTWVISAFVIDVATAKATRIAGHDLQLWSQGVWSPDGKRVAYAWRPREAGKKDGFGSDGVAPTRVVVCDTDGANAKQIFEAEEMVIPVAWW